MADVIRIPIEFDQKGALKSLGEFNQKVGRSVGRISASMLPIPALLGLAVGLAAKLGQEIFGVSEKTARLKEETEAFNKTKQSIVATQAKEIAQVGALLGVLKNENETRSRKLAVMKELVKIDQEAFKNLKLEEGAVIGVNDAYKTYLKNISLVIEAKIKQAKLEQITTKILELEGKTLTTKQREQLANQFKILKAKVDSGKATTIEALIYNGLIDKANELGDLYKEQRDILDDIVTLSKGVEVKELTTRVPKKTEEELRRFFTGRLREFQFTISKIEVAESSLERLGRELSDKLQPTIRPKVELVDPKAQRNAYVDQFRSMADMISSVLTPAAEGFIDAFREGERPLLRMMKNLMNAIDQLIKRLVAAAIQAAVLSLITGGANGVGDRGVSFLGAFKNILGVGGGVANLGNRVGYGGGQQVAVNVNAVIGERNGSLYAAVNRQTQLASILG